MFSDRRRNSGTNRNGTMVARSVPMLTDPTGINDLTSAIIGCGVSVHKVIGPGVLESIYSECMRYELRDAGLRFELERHVPLVYKGHRLKGHCYADIIVE